MLDSVIIILQSPISALCSTWIALRVGLFRLVQISLYRREICTLLWSHAGSSTSWICVCQLIMSCSFSVLWCSKDTAHCVDLQNIFLFVCYLFPWIVSFFLQATISNDSKGIFTQHCMAGEFVVEVCFCKIGWGDFRWVFLSLVNAFNPRAFAISYTSSTSIQIKMAPPAPAGPATISM